MHAGNVMAAGRQAGSDGCLFFHVQFLLSEWNMQCVFRYLSTDSIAYTIIS